MRVLRERDALRRVVEQPRKAAPHLLGLLEREIPDVIDMLGRVEPRLLLCLEGDIGPRLMGVPSQQNALSDAKTTVVLRQLLRIDPSSARIAQRSGNAGLLVARYCRKASHTVG